MSSYQEAAVLNLDMSELVLALKHNPHLETFYLPIKESGPEGVRRLVCTITNPFFTVDAYHKWRAFSVAEDDLREQFMKDKK